jgi:hypothetical protein
VAAAVSAVAAEQVVNAITDDGIELLIPPDSSRRKGA